jgi:hypothetical protein
VLSTAQIVHLLASFAAVFLFIILVAIFVILLIFWPSFQSYLLSSLVATIWWALRYLLLMALLFVCTDFAFSDQRSPNTLRLGLLHPQIRFMKVKLGLIVAVL